MLKRSIKQSIGWSLLVFMAVGLTISTLHSHHELQWHQNHPEDFADTGNCISPDTSHCPICGYILRTDLPSVDSGDFVFFSSREFNIPDNLFIDCDFEIGYTGRSPPVTG